MTRHLHIGGLAAVLALGACTDKESGEPVDPDHAMVTHSFGDYDLTPNQEVLPCAQWSLHNEEPVYVQSVLLSNDGGFHHSNWFVVPDDMFEGPDGFWDCDERGYDEIEAAVAGTVIFAQSTQSQVEEQRLPEGVVIKIPPHHKIISGVHMLNLSAEAHTTELRMSLELVHPRLVDVVVAPFRLTYRDLDILPMRESRFTGECSFRWDYENVAGKPLDMKLYYVLPHYHYLGNYFDLSVYGGPNDGQNVFRFDGFNAGANGRALDPPIDMTGATGFRFTCGYDNWRDVEIGWGIGDQEMCVMLGLADSAALVDATVGVASQAVGEQDGILMHEGPCDVIALPKNPAQGLPTEEEKAGTLYVPPTAPGDEDVDPVKECVDADTSTPSSGAPTLDSIRDTIFAPSCTFSSCHGGPGAQAGLDLRADDLHAELLGHQVAANTTLPLIAPGDPEGSWLYQLLSRCEPTDEAGAVVAHMPRNGATLLDDALVAKVREWILAGAG